MELKQKINNPLVGRVLAGGLLFLSTLIISFCIQAEERWVAPGHGELQAAIDSSHSGDTLVLSAGVYIGSVNIHRSLTLMGNKSSVIDGEGSGHVVIVSAPDVLIKGLSIQHSGNDLDSEDSAVFITDKGDQAINVVRLNV